MEAAPEEHAAPVWARETAFPESPAGWGWVDPKDGRYPCESAAALAEAICKDDGSRVCLVWTPENPRMVLPEEVSGLNTAVHQTRSRWIEADVQKSSGDIRWGAIIFSGLFGWIFLGHLLAGNPAALPGIFGRIRLAIEATINNSTIEIAFLIMVIFAIIPWYQARKAKSEFGKRMDTGTAGAVPTMRFEIWLERQKAPFTKFFLGLMIVVGAAQFTSGDASQAAGLVKKAYAAGDWWRLFTAPFLHGNIIHFLMNAAALLYLGKRLEVFARWPHLPLVFMFAAYLGGQASVYFTAQNSVGASGGLMGWLGFLLVFETLHARLVPRSARRRLAAAVFLTAIIGLLGYRFIDNAAHAGGLLAGMAYAAIVFPKSSSVYRPQSNLTDRIAGSLALAVALASAGLAIWKISAA